MKQGILIFVFTLLIQSYAYSEATCPSALPETSDSDEFDTSIDGEAYHTASGLVFMRCSLGQTWTGSSCTGEAQTFTWQEALAISQETTFNDSNNWRLPNVKELAVMLELACVRPSVNEEVFVNTQSDDYWTSTPVILESGMIWAISFANGSNVNKSPNSSLYVRLVRTKLSSE